MIRKVLLMALVLTVPGIVGGTSIGHTLSHATLLPVYPPNSYGVFKYIRDVTPGINTGEAARLAKLIVTASRKWMVDPRVLAAVVSHESRFESNLLMCRGGSEHACDHGLGQVNSVHVRELRLNRKRLVRDDAYNLDVSARLLARAQRHAHREENWYSRYHDNRPKRRAAYEEKVKPLVKKAFATVSVWQTRS